MKAKLLYAILAMAGTVGFVVFQVGFAGDIKWDTSKPNGTPRKILDSSRINNLGWKLFFKSRYYI